jgi:hypothetical protein
MTTVAGLNRAEVKKDLVEAIEAGDILLANIRLVYLEEIIDSDGFESVDEIAEVYTIKHLIQRQLS